MPRRKRILGVLPNSGGGTLVVLSVFMGMMIIIIFFALGYGDVLNLPANLNTSLWTVLPGLFITVLGLLGAATSKGSTLIVGAMGVVGIGFAVFIGELWAAGILVDGNLGTFTKDQIQILSVVMGMLLGGILYSKS